MSRSLRILTHSRSAATCAFFAASLLSSCAGEPERGHPWLDLAGAPPHEIVEVSGTTGGQLVIVVPAGSAYEDVMELGRRIAEQAPPAATVNARIFDDLDTARNWRTAPGDWTVQHLLVVVTRVPGEESADVRWMRPGEAPAADAPAAPPSEGSSAPPPAAGL
jgi:hypothetical protein